MHQVVVVLRKGKPGLPFLRDELEEIFAEAGVRAKWVSEDGLSRAVSKKTDVVVVGGGDGTMLHAARATLGSGVPLLGINLGSLGFLTSVKAGEVGTFLPKILAGDYGISARSVLVAQGGQGKSAWQSLNEISVGPAQGRLMVKVRVKVGREFLTEYHADGLLLASPTGSTAYSLSAGGPLVSPRARVIVVTPVCAHAIAQRPLVVGEQEGVEISLGEGERQAVIRCDGRKVGVLVQGKSLWVTVAKQVVRLMHPAGFGFYGLAREKLGWSGMAAGIHQ